MGFVLGTSLLLLAGFVGLTIEQYKQNKALTEEQKQLHADIKFLLANQKPVPWNKGKKGYKLPPRKPKEFPMITITEFGKFLTEEDYEHS